MSIGLLTTEYIKTVFPKYTAPAQCSKDLDVVLKIYDGLRPFKRDCVIDGDLLHMINLEGAVTVFHKGTKYIIPLRVMILEDYPYSAPLIYVQPPGNMKISKNIIYLNDRGKVSIPYLEDWRKQNDPDLYKVLVKLCDLFGENPHVCIWTKKTDTKNDTVVRDRTRRYNNGKGTGPPTTTIRHPRPGPPKVVHAHLQPQYSRTVSDAQKQFLTYQIHTKQRHTTAINDANNKRQTRKYEDTTSSKPKPQAGTTLASYYPYRNPFVVNPFRALPNLGLLIRHCTIL